MSRSGKTTHTAKLAKQGKTARSSPSAMTSALEATALQRGLMRYLSPAQLRAFGAGKVGIAGAGGLGSNCAMLLARSGVRHFLLADFDRVEESNLNRQAYFPEDLGRLKVDALAESLLRLDPGLEIELFPARLRAESLLEIFAGCAVVVEALDQAADKALLCNTLVRAGHFVVAASGIGGLGGSEGAMQKRRMGSRLVCVGDFTSEVGADFPPLAPRVMQAAALQAEAALEYLWANAALLEPVEPDKSAR